ncbi:PRKR-interacting protein 1 homolog [Hylaeus anthracinus]|uniref:PRKR-interacting protein 1 homolog n=1 Tax=Hylaeus anthracinus TaxID=313031 RepID=UPI0023B94716|nr:PRKR-interacting protein 1 homolog [Hylaeus anthracinus]
MPENKETDEEKPIVAKSAIDLQRLKLQKLMKNPEKPIVLPERPKTKNTPTVPEFVRNVMGSSAGAGSGEFHVYRHLRRKEYARQKFIQEIGRKELLDAEYHKKLEENKKIADEITAKKRAKRLKKKQKWKQKKRIKVANVDQHKKNEDSDSEQSSSEQETDEKNDNEDESVTTNETKDNEVKNNETVQTSALSTNKSIDEKSMNQSHELQLQDDCNIKNDDSEIVNNSEVSNNENDR